MKSTLQIRLFLVSLLMVYSQGIFPQAKIKYDKIPDEYMQYIHAKSQDVHWFRDARFGVFVHWGHYVLAEGQATILPLL